MSKTDKITKADALDILDLLEEHAPNWVADLRTYVEDTDAKLEKYKELFDPFDLLGI